MTFSNTAGSTVTPPVPAPEPDPDEPEPDDPDPDDPDPDRDPETVPDEEGCSAAYRVAFASATDVSASSTASCSGPFFSTASTSPASTASPTATFTLDTVPSTAKDAAAVFVRVIVPEVV